MSSPCKILKSHPPDVTVSVGSGDEKKQFQCYKVLLCLVSDYFDVMFNTDFMENATSHVAFPDKDPKGWTIFYNFISPGCYEVIDRSNVEHLLPWFHQFHMVAALRKCDIFLSQSIKHHAPLTRVIQVFKLANCYGLEEAVDAAKKRMKEFLHKCTFPYLFVKPSLGELVRLEPPLQMSESGLIITDTFWSELPYLVKKKLKLYPQNALNDIDKLVLWMEKCFHYHVCKCFGGDYSGDEFGVEDAGGSNSEKSDH